MKQAPKVTEKDLRENIAAVEFLGPINGRLTICVLTLKNGFIVTGESSCVHADNYSKVLGEQIALDNAMENIWPLMGYALRDRLQADAALLASRAFTEDRDQAVYIGTKVLHAFPMNRRDYVALRSWDLPAGENGDDEGYVVEYTDHVQDPPTVKGFKGYVSWSPKDVFEKAYRLVGGTVTQ